MSGNLELLGFPPDARVLIVSNDDLGLVCDTTGHRRGPLTAKDKAKDKASSLLDKKGEFFTPDQRSELLAQARRGGIGVGRAARGRGRRWTGTDPPGLSSSA
jgi:hypothetical protein